MSKTQAGRLPRVFLVWLFGFYAVWLGLVIFGDQWATLLANWEIAAAMAAGSYFAGSTPMGGGTIGFPVLVLFFDQPATMGRDFSVLIQSIGMVSASVYIISKGTSIAWRLLLTTAGVSIVTTPLSMFFIAPLISSYWATLSFAIIWCSFGALHIVRLRTILDAHPVPISPLVVSFLGVLVGTIGGVAVGVTGVGIDMLVYSVLVVIARVDIRVAIPTSVIIMAFNSVIGATSLWLTGGVQQSSIDAWFAAAPVVAVGAPFGAIIVERVSRTATLLVVSTLCVAQFIWALIDQECGWLDVLVSFAVVAVLYKLFVWLLNWSETRRDAHPRASHQPPATPGRLLLENDEVLATQLQQYFSIATRHKRPLSLVAIRLPDANRLKANGGMLDGDADSYLVDELKSFLRTEDMVFLAQPHHALVVLPETDEDGARKYVERVYVQFQKFQVGDRNLRDLVSCRIATHHGAEFGSLSEFVDSVVQKTNSSQGGVVTCLEL